MKNCFNFALNFSHTAKPFKNGRTNGSGKLFKSKANVCFKFKIFHTQRSSSVSYRTTLWAFSGWYYKKKKRLYDGLIDEITVWSNANSISIFSQMKTNRFLICFNWFFSLQSRQAGRHTHTERERQWKQRHWMKTINEIRRIRSHQRTISQHIQSWPTVNKRANVVLSAHFSLYFSSHSCGGNSMVYLVFNVNFLVNMVVIWLSFDGISFRCY